MKKYAVSYVHLSDNAPEIEFLDAHSECEAMRNVLAQKGFECMPLTEDMDDLGMWAFEMDAIIWAKEVPS